MGDGERRAGKGLIALPLLVLVALLGGGCGGVETQTELPALDPVDLLAKSPALPATVMAAGGGDDPIALRRVRGGGRYDDRDCDGEAAYRTWTEDGVLWAMPGVFQGVCVHGSDDDAVDAYESTSLRDVAGEDWPNFEYSDNPTIPQDAASLDALGADEWEIGCGIGEPDAGCAVWTFRARYGRVTTMVEYRASPGAISFEAMRTLLRSIDRDITTSTA